MTITFRVEDGRAILAPMAAIITPDQLASLRDLLAEQSPRLGFALLLPGYGVTGDPWFEFDVRVCHLSLAVVSKCFDHDLYVIAILDEAQFLGRRVRVFQTEPTGDITVRLSLNPDAAPQIALANPQALALLDGLGIDRMVAGMVPMTELRRRLTDPRIRRRLDSDPDMAESIEKLATMAALKPIDGEYLVAWI
ncbi:MAG: hypothetical protein EON55_13075 [Alphaproteobacteria bacterium]|nr:MAG: hypothetical protein EON55_13075 [Alphaproteobacteria bacterium]